MEKVKLTNMCMILNKNTNQVLVQDRIKSWSGITFPGGKLELGEAVIPSTIREVFEETGLTVSNLEFCGVKDWYDYKMGERYIVFLLKTSSYTGKLLDETSEGKVFWTSLDKIEEYNLSPDFLEMLDIFLGKKSEFFYDDSKDDNEEKRWVKRFY